MAGQQSYLVLSQENYYNKSKNYLIASAETYLLNKKFGVGGNLDKDKVRHHQLLHSILCTDEIDLITWVYKKREEDLKLNPMLSQFMGDFTSQEVNECCNWGTIEW